MGSMKYPFDLNGIAHPDAINLTDIQALINEICSNSSSSSTLFSDGGGRRRVSSYAWQRILLDVHVVGLLCLVGFVGNALTIAVLRRDWQDGSSATNWLLRTLAGVDTFYLVACLFIQTFKTAYDFTDWFPESMRPYFPYAERYLWPVASIGQTVTIWTVLLVTVDRYLAVCRPFDTRMRSVNLAKKLFVGVVVAAVVYNIPRFLERQVIVDTNTCTKQVSNNDLLINTQSGDLCAKMWCSFPSSSLLPSISFLSPPDPPQNPAKSPRNVASFHFMMIINNK